MYRKFLGLGTKDIEATPFTPQSLQNSPLARFVLPKLVKPHFNQHHYSQYLSLSVATEKRYCDSSILKYSY